MIKEYLRDVFMCLFIICAFALLISCGSADVATTTTTSGTPTSIQVTASSNSINPGESTQIYAAVYDTAGQGISGVEVSFSLDDPTLAYITSKATTSSAGVATATLTARSLSGDVAVTATAESVSNDPAKTITILDQSTPSVINLTINPTSIIIQGTATVTAQVLDTDGNAVPNGTTVYFEVANELYGRIASSSITSAGIATATFTAADQPGDTTINVTSGTASKSISITILQAPATSIEFVSAEPQVIAVADSGGTELSTIKFTVKDSNGNPLSDINVSLTMVGPNGGEYIDGSGDGTPAQIDVSTDSEGIAQVILCSGYVAGPVTVSATITVSGTSMTVQSSVVSIGGGVPSAKWFDVGASVLNLPGLNYIGRTSVFTAYLADRFGDYNVLTGTTVSFASEIGLAALSSDVTSDENGTATVTVRTQGGAPEDVQAEAWEVSLQTYLLTTYGVSTTAHPRDGLCSVLVYTKGEEHFSDNDADGVYDSGETFVDTFDDPFCDYNDDGQYDGSTSSDPEELYIDSADPPDGDWDGVNGVWDDNKIIYGNFQILITGQPVYIEFDTASGFAVANGGCQDMKVLVCDTNLNPLTPGSTVSISADVGKTVGNTSFTYPDTNAIGPNLAGQLGWIEYSFTLCDNDASDTDPADPAEVKTTVTWESIEYTAAIYGTVD